jgi:hypothetical protein
MPGDPVDRARSSCPGKPETLTISSAGDTMDSGPRLSSPGHEVGIDTVTAFVANRVGHRNRELRWGLTRFLVISRASLGRKVRPFLRHSRVHKRLPSPLSGIRNDSPPLYPSPAPFIRPVPFIRPKPTVRQRAADPGILLARRGSAISARPRSQSTRQSTG